MRIILFSIIYYCFIEISIPITLYLYSDDYNFPWSTHDDGLKYLHLILTIPVFLLFALLSTFGDRFNQKIRNLFVLLCFLFISIYMGIDGESLGETKLLVGAILVITAN